LARRTPYNMLLHPTPLRRLAASNTALLLLDAQRYATSREHGLGMAARERAITREFDEYYSMAEAALGNMSRLLAAARRQGALVVHALLMDRGPGTVSRQLALAGLPLPQGDPLAELCAEVAPQSGEVILPRGGYGCFAATQLDAQLAARGIERVVICGMLANITVVLAAREAADCGYAVVVVQDAAASETLDWHAVTMLGIAGGLIRVHWADEVIEMLEGTRT